MSPGARYLLAHHDGRVRPLLVEYYGRWERGDVVLAEQSERSLDEIAWGRRADGSPLYTPHDVLDAGREAWCVEHPPEDTHRLAMQRLLAAGQ